MALCLIIYTRQFGSTHRLLTVCSISSIFCTATQKLVSLGEQEPAHPETLSGFTFTVFVVLMLSVVATALEGQLTSCYDL